MTGRRALAAGVTLAAGCVLWGSVLAGQPGTGLATAQPDERARAQAASQRAAERIRALQRESDALVTEARTLLAELRKLEIDRALRAEELVQIGAELAETRQALAETIARAEALGEAVAAEGPQVEARLVQLYKLGRAGYWRLLLDTNDVRTVGRAYRTASAMQQMDRERLRAHAAMLATLTRERQALEAREKAIAALQARATAARAAADRAVAARSALLASIDEQRDLNAQMTGELEAAQIKLQQTVHQLAAGAAPSSLPSRPILPLRPFRGELPWPVDGIVTQRFGRQPAARGAPAVTRNGVEISIAEGRPARAVHEGTVAFAGPFTGYGNLVILEHGDGSHSLYGHLAAVGVQPGDRVDGRATIGETGRNPSGNPALYFELRVDGQPVDPLQWLRKLL